VILTGDNSLSKTAMFLTETSHFLPQREARDSTGALSFFVSRKNLKKL
jgi:hypothetical protein